MGRVRLRLRYLPTLAEEPDRCTPSGSAACRLSIRHQRLPTLPNAPHVPQRRGFSPNSLKRLHGLSRFDALTNRRQQKSGLAPTLSCDPFPSEERVYSGSTVKSKIRWGSASKL